MKECQKKFFEPRTNTVHKEDLISMCSGDDTDEEFRSLVRQVFAHHMSEIPEPANLQWQGNIDHLEFEGLPDTAFLRYRFHTYHYAKVKLRLGSETGPEISIDKLAERLSQRTLASGDSNVHFLIGGIGTGKSTLISNLLVTRGLSWINSRGIWPLRVDMDDLLDHAEPLVPSKTDLLRLLYDSIAVAVAELGNVDEDVIARIVNSTRCPDDASEQVAVRSIIGLLKAVDRNFDGKRILLMIDNLDFLYHLFDRAAFAPEPDKTNPDLAYANRDAAFDLVQYLVRLVLSRTLLGKSGLNVLIVLRPDSVQYYMDTRRKNRPLPFEIATHTYYYDPPELDDVLRSYCSLFREAIRTVSPSGKRKLFEEMSPHFEASITREGSARHRRLYSSLEHLTKQGLREIVSHLSVFSWLRPIRDDQGHRQELTTRFKNQLAPSLLAFLLGGKKLYSQFSSLFPNIYLVRSDCYKELTLRVPKILLASHAHSYWLKRLLLHFVHHKAKETEAPFVSPESIYQAFCQTTERQDAYEESIVRLCLGSLAQADFSGLLTYRFDSGTSSACPVVDRVSLTPRATYLLSGFIDSFQYLQLVVDDPLLPIPRSAEPFFRYHRLDYSYLVQEIGKYQAGAAAMIAHKAKEVRVFLEVLAVSLDLEASQFQSVFRGLREQGVLIPSPGHIEESVGSHVREIIRRFPNIDYSDCWSIPESLKSSIRSSLRAVHASLRDENEVVLPARSK